MIPVNLNQRQMRIGMGQGVPPELAQILAQQQPQGAPAPEQAQSTNPRSMAVADVLSNPVTVESGHWGEALAEALGSGIRGRAMRDVYGREQEQQQQEQDYQRVREKTGDARDMEQHQMAMQQMQAEVLAAQNPEAWSEPFDFEGGTAQRNNRTNEHRVLTRRPAASSRGTPTPALPDGFQWE